MPLGFKHFTEPLTFSERAELKAENEAWRAMETRIAELEAALDDAYPFVCIAVDRYRQDHGLDKLHEKHADIADRIARLTGRERMPSKYLVKS